MDRRVDGAKNMKTVSKENQLADSRKKSTDTKRSSVRIAEKADFLFLVLLSWCVNHGQASPSRLISVDLRTIYPRQWVLVYHSSASSEKVADMEGRGRFHQS